MLLDSPVDQHSLRLISWSTRQIAAAQHVLIYAVHTERERDLSKDEPWNGT